MNLGDLLNSGAISIDYQPGLSGNTNWAPVGDSNLGNTQFGTYSAPAPVNTGGRAGSGAVSAPAPNPYYYSALDSLNRAGDILNERQGQYNADLDSQFNTSQSRLYTDKNIGDKNLERQRETETRTKNMSLRDLVNNIRNAYNSGVNKLGIQGAGDSSATNMYRFALGQLEGQNRADLINNYQYNQGNIDLAASNLQQDFEQKLRELDDWKRSQAFAIADKFRVARDQLEEQKRTLNASGQAAVSQQQAALANQAATSLSQVDAAVSGAAQAIQNNFAERSAALRAYDQSNVNPNIVTQSGINSGIDNGGLVLSTGKKRIE